MTQKIFLNQHSRCRLSREPFGLGPTTLPPILVEGSVGFSMVVVIIKDQHTDGAIGNCMIQDKIRDIKHLDWNSKNRNFSKQLPRHHVNFPFITKIDHSMAG